MTTNMPSETAPHAPRIMIPPQLLPSDGRFGSGPSKVRTDAVAALADAGRRYLGTSHRRSTVRSVVRRLREGLVELLSLPDGYEVLVGNGGTTAFWDSAIFGLIERRSQHASFGEFSSKFASCVRAAPHLDDPEVLESAPGTHPFLHATHDVDAYCLTQNETSTGVAMPVARPDGAATDQLILVDATSAAGGLRFDPTEVDVYYFAPQKCLGSDGGLWLAACSPAAIDRIQRLATSGRWIPPFLDLHIALENSRQNQTYNTPALATIFLALNQVEWCNERGGLPWAAKRCDESAATIYSWAEESPYATPFVTDSAMRSNVVATIDLHDVDATVVSEVLRHNGIVDTESYRKLGRNQLRVALFPAIEPDDVESLTHCVDYIVECLRE